MLPVQLPGATVFSDTLYAPRPAGSPSASPYAGQVALISRPRACGCGRVEDESAELADWARACAPVRSETAGGDHGFTRDAQPAMKNTLTIDQFVAILEAAGVGAETRLRIHEAFESQRPEAHQAFLEWLGAGPDDVKQIRSRSR